MFVPRETAGWVLDFLESAAGALAIVDAALADPAAVEPELPRRLERARAELDKAAHHAAVDAGYGAWMGADAWTQFSSTLAIAGEALDGALQAQGREPRWREVHRAIEYLTAALDFSRIIWQNLPPESEEPAAEPAVELEA